MVVCYRNRRGNGVQQRVAVAIDKPLVSIATPHTHRAIGRRSDYPSILSARTRTERKDTKVILHVVGRNIGLRLTHPIFRRYYRYFYIAIHNRGDDRR